jgi:hypothetical protein
MTPTWSCSRTTPRVRRLPACGLPAEPKVSSGRRSSLGARNNRGRAASRTPSAYAARPGPGLGYAAFPPPPSRDFGHGLQRLRRLPIAGPGKRDETRRSQRRLLDRCVGMFLEQALEPPGPRLAGSRERCTRLSQRVRFPTVGPQRSRALPAGMFLARVPAGELASTG